MTHSVLPAGGLRRASSVSAPPSPAWRAARAEGLALRWGSSRRLAACLLFAVILAGVGHATVYTVDTMTDDADDQSGVVDGLVSLREAIVAANTNVPFGDAPAGNIDGDQIQFSSSGTVVLGGGELLITDDLAITATGVTLDGGMATRIFTFDAGGGPGTVDAVSITGGTLTDGEAGAGAGGAIRLLSGTATLDGVTFDGNQATRGGAVAHVAGNGSVLTSTDCQYLGNVAVRDGGAVNLLAGGSLSVIGGSITGNTAGEEGGGVWNGPGGTMTIEEATIRLNMATVGNAANDAQGGGGVFNSGGTLSIRSSRIAANEVSGVQQGADDGGGGIFHDGRTTAGAVSIANTIIEGNLALSSDSSGGGILALGTAGNETAFEILGGEITGNQSTRTGGGIEARHTELTLTQVTLSGNTTGLNGGGLHTTEGGATSIAGGVIFGNEAGEEGGGLWNSATGTMTVDGVLITLNSALVGNATGDAQGGGGVFNDGGRLTIQNATILGNQVIGSNQGVDDGGGGISSDGRNTPGTTVTVTNTLIADNTALSAGSNGGGVLTIGSSSLGNKPRFEIVGGRVTGNQAARAGGGIESFNSVLLLTDVEIEANEAGVNGGGIHTAGGDTVSIAGGTIGDNTAQHEGGGLWNSFTGVTEIDGTLIRSNTALVTGAAADAEGGGGVFNNGGRLTIRNATILGNQVIGSNQGGDDGGGGIFNDGRITPGATVTVTNTLIADNTALSANSNGGGVLTIGDSSTGNVPSFEMIGGRVTGNQVARAGGGISSNNSILALSGVELDSNETGVNGGGVHIAGSDTVSITGGTIGANYAAQEGGGVWNSATGTMTIDGTLIRFNTAAAGFSADAQGGGGVFNNGGTVTINNATIQQNAVIGALGSEDGGGGIFNDGRNTGGATVFLRNTVVVGNRATGGSGQGGGVMALGEFAMPYPLVQIAGGRISGNEAANGGGGIYGEMAILSLVDVVVRDNRAGSGGGVGSLAGEATIDSSTIRNNLAASTGGGVLGFGGLVEITGSVVQDNQAGRDGGGVGALGVLEIGPGTRVFRNLALRNGGGVLYAGSGASATVDLRITDALIDQNVAVELGGGLYLESAGEGFSIERSSFAYNLAADGGGAFLDDDTAATDQISNSTFFGNDATSGPGGLFVAGDVELIHSTVHENRGGGVDATTGSLVLLNSSVTHDQAEGADCVGGGVTASGANFDSDGSCGASLSGDPLLGAPAADYTLAPLPGSPLIDAADPTACLTPPVNGSDQQTGGRPFGAACDLGSIEAGAAIFSDGFESGNTGAWSSAVGG